MLSGFFGQRLKVLLSKSRAKRRHTGPRPSLPSFTDGLVVQGGGTTVRRAEDGREASRWRLAAHRVCGGLLGSAHRRGRGIRSVRYFKKTKKLLIIFVVE